MGAEDGDGAGRDLVDLVDKMRALSPQPLDYMPIVNYFVTDIDRRTKFFECAFDDLDRSFNPCAEPSGLGQHHPHCLASLHRTGRPDQPASDSTVCTVATYPCHNSIRAARLNAR